MIEYAKGKIGPMVSCLSKQYGFDPYEAAELLKREFPELNDKSKCANCKASMNMYVFHLDILNALLVYKMGKIIREKINRGIVFEEANRVHVQSEVSASYAVKSRTTYCAKLGLIAKVKNGAGEHDRRRGWLITSRGWAFLRGEAVPEHVTVFRNEIEERTDELITMGDVFRLYAHNTEKNIARGKYLKENHVREISEYDRADWVDFAGPQQGKLL